MYNNKKTKMRMLEIDMTFKTLSEKLNIPYTRLISYTNGFSAMPSDVENEIHRILKKDE